MNKFTHIESFKTVSRYIQKLNNDHTVPVEYKVLEPVTFTGHVKLHGTNCSVVCTKDGFQPQSRNRVLSVSDDHLGFAKFVSGEKQLERLNDFRNQIISEFDLSSETNISFYGEWIGPGIQKGVALSQLPEKQWVIFAVKVDNKYNYEAMACLEYDRIIPQESSIYTIDLCDSYSILDVDFTNKESVSNAYENAKRCTLQVEKQCPWAEMFGISGIGEGIVWQPFFAEKLANNEKFFWKSKGEKHQVVKEGRPPISLELQQKIDSFVEATATENRLNQGLEYLKEMNIPSDDIKSVGKFIGWVGKDIKRECTEELNDYELDWTQVSKAINTKARIWFMKINQM